MPRATAPRARAGVSFEVERLDLEDDRLVVTGHWSGLRGLRFMRPTLLVGNRHVHATLEHKPWAPTAGEPWTAAFPWRQGDELDATGLALSVAPSVTVALGPQADAEEPLETALPSPPPARRAAETQPSDAAVSLDRMRAARLEEDLAELTQAHAALREEHDAALARIAEREERCQQLEHRLRDERTAALDTVADRDELVRARSAAERDRDRALEQRDEAIQDRAASNRSRGRLQGQYDEAVKAHDAAAAQLEQAIGERDEARAQRDEVLVAYRALQRHVQSTRAEADRLQTEPLPAAGEDRTEPLPTVGQVEPPHGDADPDEPIGVRTVPAARTVLAELQRPEPARKFVVSKFDLWAIRGLGTVAAACFILLLVSLVRVFI